MGHPSIVWLAAGAAMLGVITGSFLRKVVLRVHRGEPLVSESRCPSYARHTHPRHSVPAISWIAPRAKCAHCHTPISVRYPLVELGTGAAFAVVTVWAVTSLHLASAVAYALALAAYLWFAAAAVALIIIDIEHQRLPNRIVMPSLAIVGALLIASGIVEADFGRVISTLGGAMALFVVYLLIVFIYPRGVGMGDVKLAPLIGAVCGFVGWHAVTVGGYVGFLLGALWATALILLRRAKRRTRIPFGPFMVMGGAVGMLLVH